MCVCRRDKAAKAAQSCVWLQLASPPHTPPPLPQNPGVPLPACLPACLPVELPFSARAPGGGGGGGAAAAAAAVAFYNSFCCQELDSGCCTAGALAVEMMASVLQHPAGIYAPALDTSGAGFGASRNPEEGEEGHSVLGQVPHRIHGRLTGFTQHCLTGQAFSQCTACSACVVQQYKQQGWQFLQQALQVCPAAFDTTFLGTLSLATDG